MTWPRQSASADVRAYRHTYRLLLVPGDAAVEDTAHDVATVDVAANDAVADDA